MIDVTIVLAILAAIGVAAELTRHWEVK